MFALGMAAGGTAEASCGDWLAGHGDEPVVENRTGPTSPAIPCNGPSCRRSRENLPIAPLSPSRQFEQPERWLTVFEDLSSRPVLVTALPGEVGASAIDGLRPAIDRPPRG